MRARTLVVPSARVAVWPVASFARATCSPCGPSLGVRDRDAMARLREDEDNLALRAEGLGVPAQRRQLHVFAALDPAHVTSPRPCESALRTPYPGPSPESGERSVGVSRSPLPPISGERAGVRGPRHLSLAGRCDQCSDFSPGCPRLGGSETASLVPGARYRSESWRTAVSVDRLRSAKRPSVYLERILFELKRGGRRTRPGRSHRLPQGCTPSIRSGSRSSSWRGAAARGSGL
jgi:hypothetical protein